MKLKKKPSRYPSKYRAPGRQFLRLVRSACAAIVSWVEPRPAVRLYWSHPREWTLQVRACINKDSKLAAGEFVVASAPLNRQQLRALRSAIDTFLGRKEV